MERYNLVSFLGIFILIAFAYLLSADRKNIDWRIIAAGTALQLLFGFFLFVVPAGRALFVAVNDGVVSLLSCASEGSKFLFGALASPPGEKDSLGFILAFQALPTIIFFSSLMSVLYYTGIMPKLIKLFSSLFTRFMHISGAESLCASSNIFVGIESALTIRPFVAGMTRSELLTVLTAGMSTIASSVLAFYTLILGNVFPEIAGHLVSASILSAPAAIVMSKILLPEKQIPETMGISVNPEYERPRSMMDAVIEGANTGVKLVVSIGTLLIAFLGLVALVNLFISGCGSLFESLTGIRSQWSLEKILSYAAYPFVLATGVPPADVPKVAVLIGKRLILTEVPSYMDLAQMVSNGSLVNPRSFVIAVYSLCGFAHVAALAIFVGGFSSVAPERSGTISAVGPRALLAATLASLMTASVAGTFFSGTGIILSGGG